MEGMKKMSKKINIFIFSVVLMDVLGLSILMTVNVYIVRAYNTSALAVTMLSVIYAAAQFLAAPILGRLSDRYGRRPILLICIFGSAVGYFMFGIGGALWILFLSRFIDGITGGNFSVANAYIADVTTEKERAKNYALIGSAFGVGFILGPAAGGLLSQINLSAPAYAAGIFPLINFIMGLFILPESLPVEKRWNAVMRLKDFNPLASIFQYFRQPNLWGLLMIYALFQLAFMGNTSIYQVFVIHKYSVPPASLAILLTVSGVGNVVAQGFLVGPLVRVAGEKKLVGISLIAQAVMLMLTFLLPVFWMQFPFILISTAFNGFIWPTLTAMISKMVPQNEQGSISGTTMALGSIMSIVGPLVAGTLYDTLGYAAPFVAGAVIFVVAFLLLDTQLSHRKSVTV
jgi:multidrug resistance protein